MNGPSTKALTATVVQMLVIVLATSLSAAIVACAGGPGAHLVSTTLYVTAGVVLGMGVALYTDAHAADERLREEGRRAARELVDKQTFAGWRRHS